MSKILILAATGFGKTSSIGPITKEDFLRAGIPDTEILGLNPSETFIISCSNKNLPIPRWRQFYQKAEYADFIQNGKGNLVVTNNADQIVNLISLVNANKKRVVNIVLDDNNYVMQDYYMSKALTTGFDVFKKIGAMMGGIFNEMEKVSAEKKNFIMMAHMEEYKDSNLDTLSYRYKTVGKMVNDYITPEGKFEIVLFGKQTTIQVDGRNVVKKQFVTNYDGQYPAKSPIGMFPDLYVPNDLGYVLNQIKAYESFSEPQIQS